METQENNKKQNCHFVFAFEKCMPDPITDAVQAWAYHSPLRPPPQILVSQLEANRN